MQINDIVARKSYNCDIWFRVCKIDGENITLNGLEYRLIADAHYSDLEKVNTRGSSNSDIEDRSNSLFKTWYMNQSGIEVSDKKMIK